MAGVFPDLLHCKCQIVHHEHKKPKDNAAGQGLLAGTKTGDETLAGFPTVQTHSVRGLLAPHGVQVFNHPSKNDSMVVYLNLADDEPDIESLARGLIGRRAFYDWPYVKEGHVVGVSNSAVQFSLDGKTIRSVPHDRDIGRWERNVDRMVQTYSKRQAVIIGEVEIVVHLQPLIGLFAGSTHVNIADLLHFVGMEAVGSGAIRKYFEPSIENEVTAPLQVLLRSVKNADPRFKVGPPYEWSESLSDLSY